MNVKEYARKMKVSASTVYDWIKKGYLPNVKDVETGRINIPEDMPRPYKSNGKTKKIDKLEMEIIKAANLQQSLYPKMFPLVREDTFWRTIDSMLACCLISRQQTLTGAVFYELGTNWRSTAAAEKTAVLDTIAKSMDVCASVAQIVQVVMTVCPLLMPALQQAVQTFS